MTTNVPSEIPAGPRKGDQEFFSFIVSDEIRRDFRKLVQAVWPWGKENTFLHDRKEPKRHQIEFLETLTEHQRVNRIKGLLGQSPELIQSAQSGGRGAGKTAIEFMVMYACFAAYYGMTIIITANNQDQLHNRAFAELARWHSGSLCAHWFERGTYSLRPHPWYAKKLFNELGVNLGYYHMIGQLWDESRPEAFAGAHNPAGLIVNFQEAIGIPRPIWTVTKGFFTEPSELRMFLVSSNMRQNVGPFVECFRKNRAEWYRRMIDSRNVEGVDVKIANSVIAEFGESSPEACAEVTGKIPGFSSRQAIPLELIEKAMTRELPPVDGGQPVTIGVDAARFGSNKSTIWVRRGYDMRFFKSEFLRGQDTVALANAVISVVCKIYEVLGIYPSAINIDTTGVGGGTYDILKDRGYKKLNSVDFGSQAEEPEKYRNRRTEIYFRMKQWLKDGGCLPNHEELHDDLAGPEYGYSGDNSVLILESKEDMEARGLASPDDGDGACLTLATRVARLDANQLAGGRANVRIADGVEANPWYE